jgi:uncharacterized membrane protein
MDAFWMVVLFFGALWVSATWWCMILFARMARRVKRISDLLEELNRTLAPAKQDDPSYRL